MFKENRTKTAESSNNVSMGVKEFAEEPLISNIDQSNDNLLINNQTENTDYISALYTRRNPDLLVPGK
eukprot:CAMPEP_0116871146 /NCGR_PEP_ID=MMETSP0463-20121206/1366_1 /TAXON_ID=181622 /ORGANISM="Strombidinopsis sp, Strain SopsisLIS2011" /LENGTH=67 /DNA_ID=CAMNT_0004509015 /DNA_START=246 /DNA_END=449 /DNA_ORIENTATION=-